MKIDALGVSSQDLSKTIKFYSLLGFEFPQLTDGEDHIEATNGGIRLMVDSSKLIEEILGERPRAGNTSAFALLFDSSEEVNESAQKLSSGGFTVIKEPWDAPWGQRYSIVEDPDGYRIDLFSYLS